MRFALISDFAFANLEMKMMIITNCANRVACFESYRNILKRDDAAWLFISCVLKVVQTVIIEDEPSTLPAFVSSALLPEPAFLIRIEKRVHQVVTIILWYLERLSANRFVQRLEEFSWEISAIINATIHWDKLLDGRLVLYRWIMQRCVQHDYGEAQNVTSIGIGEYVRVQLTVSLCKTFHHSVDFLSLAWQTKAP